jgi:hypothetical protein
MSLFALVYGFLGREPPPLMQMLLGLGPAVAVAAWLAADARHTRTVLAHDTGFLFYLTWPVSIPWYAVRTRGRRGWRLAAQLYVIDGQRRMIGRPIPGGDLATRSWPKVSHFGPRRARFPLP